MYKFKAQRDQQQNTSLHYNQSTNLLIVKCTRLQTVHQHHPQNKMQLDFNIHENHQHTSTWSALEHKLRTSFEDIVSAELLPTAGLKIHIFVLNQDKHIESAIFNATWLCFVLHGVPLTRSVFHYQWNSEHSQGKAVYDLHDPSTIFAGEYNAPPPDSGLQACKEFKQNILGFLEREWAR